MPKINILDNLKQIKKIDSANMIGSLELLAEQIKDVFQEAEKINFPDDYKKVKNILVLGMGGSALGTHIIKSCFSSELNIPVEILNNYHIPQYVGPETLVLASSYSGNTEEVLSAVEEARRVRSKLVIISAGGELEQFAKNNKIPALIFSVKNNPCGSPRMGLGYSVFGQIILLAKAGLLKFSQNNLTEILSVIERFNREYGLNNLVKNNLAKKFAQAVIDRSIWYVASEHLEGNAHVGANQINENAKRFGGYFILPEMNHHLLEGLKYPKNNDKNLLFILLESNLYDERIQKRYEIIKKVLNKNKIKFLAYKTAGPNKLAEVMEVLLLSSYLSYYGAILKGLSPTAIPFVNYFKEQLKK